MIWSNLFFFTVLFYLPTFISLRVSTQPTPSAVPLGKKRAWVPDEKEAYIEIEIKETSGDKVTVETKDGRVSDHCFICSDEWKNLLATSSSCLPASISSDSDSEGRGHPADEPS